MTGPSVRRAGVTVIVSVIAAKAAGFLREIVVAGTYGTSHVVDVYLAAVTVPVLINSILYQALPNAFVPLFARTGHNREKAPWVAWAILAVMALASAALWLLAEPVARLTNTGFAKLLQAQTVFLVRIAAGSVFLSTIESLARSRLLAQKRFIQTGISSLWLSLAIIGAVTFFPEAGARSLAWGFLAGGACVAVWNLIPLGPRGSAAAVTTPSLRDAEQVTSAGVWVIAVILLNTIAQVYGLIDRHFGSFLAEGSIAALQYASTVASQPLAICATALGTAILPYLADCIGADDRAAAASLFDRAVRWSLLGSIPAAVALVILGGPIVTVLFERGEFNAAARSVTAPLLSAYGVWILPVVLTNIIGKVFYASLRWRPITLAFGVALVIKAGLSYWWVRSYDVMGLVAATTVATAVSTLVLFAFLPGWATRGLWTGWLRLAAATTLMFAVTCGLARMIPVVLPMLSWKASALVSVVLGIGGGTGLLLLLGPRCGIGEIVRARDAIRTVLLRRS